MAVPLVDDRGTLGVLEVLDKRSEASFSLRDIELAGVFARQATVAIRASRVERDTAALLRSVIAALAGGRRAIRGIDALVAAALVEVGDPDDPLWPLVEQVAALRRVAPEHRELLGRPPGGLVRQAGRRPGRRTGAARRSGRSAPPMSDADHEVRERLVPAWSDPFLGARRDGLARLPPLPGPDARLGVRRRDRSRPTGGDHRLRRGGIPSRRRWAARPQRPRGGGPPTRTTTPASCPTSEAIDVVGHGTACAGIVHSIAPEADLVSVRVLNPDNRGKGLVLAAGLEWAIEQGASVVNLSLSSRSDAFFGLFHELADRAYFAGVLLVCAANNVPGASYPSLFASVVSVAAHDVADPATWYYNPRPPVEFGARGVDVEVAWRDGGRITAAGNSFAAPHIAGYAALIRAAHPDASPFEVKAILAATATLPGS